jgi:hypothetical protein
MKPTSAVRPLVFWFAALLIMAASSARGQNTPADRARFLQQQQAAVPSTAPGVSGTALGQNYAAPSPNDEDLGEQAILKRVEKYDPFTLDISVPIYYTSNVALVDHGAVSDTIIAPAIALTYAPRITRTLYGQFTLRQQFFYYQDFTSFNFASFDAIAGLSYYVPELHNLVLRGNLDYNRLSETDNFDDFFSDVSLGLNAEVPFAIGRAQQISLGADALISLHADPTGPQRSEFGAYAAYTVNLSRSLSLVGAGRIVVRPYHTGGRTDVSEILSASANYAVRNWLTISAITSFVANQSNQDVFSYRVFNIGGGINVSWKF